MGGSNAICNENSGLYRNLMEFKMALLMFMSPLFDSLDAPNCREAYFTLVDIPQFIWPK
jgi:hypothetical protein